MSKVLCTMPGKFGDILWALPTLRAVSNALGEPVDFLTSYEYGDPAFLRLINKQPYIDIAFSLPSWHVYDTAPMTPREPEADLSKYEQVVHLGYKEWPEHALMEETFRKAEVPQLTVPDWHEAQSPWVTLGPTTRYPNMILVCWSPEWIELKLGLALAVANALLFSHPNARLKILCPPRACRQEEWASVLPENCCLVHADWMEACRWMEQAALYLGCLSAPWVLANATGTRVVAVEPNPQRHHPIFWRESELNRLVLGGDGKPTFDARAAVQAVQEALSMVPSPDSEAGG